MCSFHNYFPLLRVYFTLMQNKMTLKFHLFYLIAERNMHIDSISFSRHALRYISLF